MNQLTIYRIKREITDPDAILPNRDALVDIPVRIDERIRSVLYVDRSTQQLPRWFSYFKGAVSPGARTLSTAVVSAVLLISHEGRLFAVVFGYGRFLLAQDAVEHRFGLRATLNAVDPAQLRAVDHKRLEATLRHTREELSRGSSVSEFGMDVERDLLRAVTGVPADPQHGKRLGGADQLSVVGDIPLKELTSYLGRFGRLADQTAYKKSFSWVDNIAEVTDPSVIRELDERLVKRLKIRSDDFWTGPPEIVDWINVATFRYSTRKTALDYADIDLDDYFDEYGSRLDLSVGRLRHDKVYCLSAQDENLKRVWPIYRCLIGELAQRDERYTLSEGKWYRVDRKFLEDLDTYVADFPRSPMQLPAYEGNGEGAYNKMAAKQLTTVTLLDQSFIQFPGRGKVEVCDLYTEDKVFVHVKRYGASSKLSHLFSQGTVSAQLMVSEPAFRRDFQQKLPARYQWGDPDAPIKADEFQVCYAIIGRKGKALSLPFFSRMSLRTAARSIRGLGLQVTLAEIAAKA